VDLAHGAEAASRTVTDVLGQLDIDSVRVVDGRIDVDAVRALEAPLATVRQTIDELQALLDEADDQWLVSPIRDRLHRLDADIDDYRGQADDALAAVRAAPGVLGADGRRVYFIAFTTPAEARGSLGFMGNWAELTVDNGMIDMTRFGRTTELNDAGGPDRRLTGMDEFLARYGGYGFNTGPGGTTAEYVWQVITMSPDFPTVAEAIAQLYPQSGGQEIDGVFALDPTALAALLEFTGPIDAEGVPYPLDASNAEEFLSVDQYVVVPDKPERVDALEAVASTTVDKVLGGALPDPVELGKTFGPLVREHHIAGWLRDPEEQDLGGRLELDHALPEPEGTGLVAVAISNSGGSKIDAYADVTVDYTIDADASDPARASVAVTIANQAPASGLPPYVIGNFVDLPLGTNVSYVSVYVDGEPTAMTVDGEVVPTDITFERGWYVASAFVQIASGTARTFTVDFASKGAASAGGEPPAVFGPDTRRTPTIVIDGVEQ
jgi:hypothetical protein